VQLIPAALGADGPRNWLVIAQNNAEQRPSGGIVGAVIALQTIDGQIKIIGHASTSDFERDTPILPLTNEEVQLFGEKLGSYIQNATLTPDFPRSAQFVSEWWRYIGGEAGAGVISMDPVLIQTLLAITGPVTFTDPLGAKVTIDGHNAADFFLSQVYFSYPDPEVQDVVFNLAAMAVFDAVVHGDWDAYALIDALDQLAGAGRLSVWSPIASEQALIAPTRLSGALRGAVLTADGEISPVVGVYLGLGSESKMGFYLDVSAEITDEELLADGSHRIAVTLSLSNWLTAAQLSELPNYVLWNNSPDGIIPIIVYVYAPTGGAVLSASDAAGEAQILRRNHNGLAVGVFQRDISPGSTHVIELELVSGPGQTGAAQLQLTPGPR